jgi:hypothetical protein
VFICRWSVCEQRDFDPTRVDMALSNDHTHGTHGDLIEYTDNGLNISHAPTSIAKPVAIQPIPLLHCFFWKH